MIAGRQGCLCLAYKDCSIKIGTFRYESTNEVNRSMEIFGYRTFFDAADIM